MARTSSSSGKSPAFVIPFIIVVLVLVFCLRSWGTIDAGSVGLKTQWGRITSGPIDPGLVWINPFGGGLVKYDCREQRTDLQLPTYTKDVQTADIGITVTFAVKRDEVVRLHSSYGQQYSRNLILPVVTGITKDVIGQVEADTLVSNREAAARDILKQVEERLAASPIEIRSLTIANIDYSDAFEKAIEQKQVAMQDAIRAKNRTQQVEEEARQKLILAEADAKSMEIRGQAISANPGVITLSAIEKWDGRAPNTLVVGSDAAPILNSAAPAAKR